MTTLLLAGATGLVGQSVLQQALQHPQVSRITALTRRPLPPHAKLVNPVVDFDHLPADAEWWQADAALCTLGTTLRQAGSREAFRKVDFDYPLAVARNALAHGTRRFLLNSALGADSRSRIAYSRTKGELEDALRALPFSSLTLVRPALIGGQRDSFRPVEFFSALLLQALRPLVPLRYRVVSAERIAFRLLESALSSQPGIHVWESEQLHGGGTPSVPPPPSAP